MAKSRARYLAELLNSEGFVQANLSALAGADEVIDLEVLPAIPNSQLEHSSVSIAGHTLSLGGSLTLNTADIGEHESYLYYTNARARAAFSVLGSLSYNSTTGVLSYTTPTTIASLSNHDTDDLAEGTNLYYTNARFDTRLATKTTTDLSEGTNLYWTTARGDSNFSTNLAASDTDDLSEGATNLYYTNARFDTRLATKTTTDLSEGTNLYWTTARGDSNFSTNLAASDTDDLSEGATNLYYTDSRANANFDTRLATKSTTNLAEGTNLYYTDARVGSYLTTNSYATQSYVGTQIANLVDSAPGTLDTLNELAAALGDDANFSTTLTNSIATKWTQDNTKISNWDTAYGWGDHGVEGYLTGNQTITLTGDVSGSGTTSISVTVADDSHNHVISNVDGLQTALDAKQDASTALTTSNYTSTLNVVYANRTGDTFTGNVLFSDSGTTKRGIRGIVGTNDYWFFGGGATASNAGYVEIAAGDDGSTAGSYEPIYVRQYYGDPLTGTVQRTLTLLDNNGDTDIPNDLTIGGDIAAVTRILFDNAHQKDKIKLIPTGNEWIGTSGATLELSGDSINLNAGRGTGTPTLKMSGVTVLDTSRNLINIGTISSGAITSTGTSAINNFRLTDSSKMGFGTVKAGSTLAHTASIEEGIFWHSSADYGVYRTAGAWSGNYQQLRLKWLTGIELDGGSAYGKSGVNIINSDLQIDGTTVIDSSRNLTNIAGINATGQIVTGDNLKVGGYFLIDSDGDFTGSNYYTIEDTSGDRLRLARAFSATNNVELDSSGNFYVNGGRLEVSGDIQANNFTASTYQINGTTVIDSSRNLRNITTIDVGGSQSGSANSIFGTNQYALTVQASGNNASATFNDTLFIRNNNYSSSGVAGQKAQIGFATIESDGDHHRAQIIAKRDTSGGTAGGQLELLTRTAGGAPATAVTLRHDKSAEFAGSIKIGGTTVIDSSRNLTNIGDASLTGELVVNSANTTAKYLYINKGTGDGGILWRLSNLLKFQNVLSGNDLAWYSYELASIAFVMYGSGEFTAKNGYQVNGTTVIDSSRNLTNISGITASKAGDTPFFFKKTNNGAYSNVAMLVENQYGNHSWGMVGELRVAGDAGSDDPSLLFSQGYNSNTYSIGFGYKDHTNFRIKRDHGHRNSGWGTSLMTMDRSGNVTFAGNVTAYSDERLKENIQTIPNALESVKQLRGVTYNWKETGEQGLGVIAQEVEAVEITKCLVSETPEDGAAEFRQKNVAYGNMVGLLIEAMKEQQTQIEALQAKIEELENGNH